MSNQKPQPGDPHQPGRNRQPGRGPQPPRRRRDNAGRIVGFSCLGVVGLVLAFAIGGAALLGGEEDNSPARTDPAATGPAATTGKGGGTGAGRPGTRKPADEPVKIMARRTDFKAGALADGTAYTSVRITIANNGEGDIGVNPLYFSLTATDGSRHTAELAVDEDQIATVNLAPGENVTGTVTGKGTFTPEYVTYVDGLLGDSVRADVS